jgi:hypothetical protein
MLTWNAAFRMSSDFAWSLSKAYTLSFVGLYVTMYLSSYNFDSKCWSKRKIKMHTVFHIYIYKCRVFSWLFVSVLVPKESIPQIEVL